MLSWADLVEQEEEGSKPFVPLPSKKTDSVEIIETPETKQTVQIEITKEIQIESAPEVEIGQHSEMVTIEEISEPETESEPELQLEPEQKPSPKEVDHTALFIEQEKYAIELVETPKLPSHSIELEIIDKDSESIPMSEPLELVEEEPKQSHIVNMGIDHWPIAYDYKTAENNYHILLSHPPKVESLTEIVEVIEPEKETQPEIIEKTVSIVTETKTTVQENLAKDELVEPHLVNIGIDHWPIAYDYRTAEKNYHILLSQIPQTEVPTAVALVEIAETIAPEKVERLSITSELDEPEKVDLTSRTQVTITIKEPIVTELTSTNTTSEELTPLPSACDNLSLSSTPLHEQTSAQESTIQRDGDDIDGKTEKVIGYVVYNQVFWFSSLIIQYTQFVYIFSHVSSHQLVACYQTFTFETKQKNVWNVIWLQNYL